LFDAGCENNQCDHANVFTIGTIRGLLASVLEEAGLDDSSNG
jgi:hypothetical protein